MEFNVGEVVAPPQSVDINDLVELRRMEHERESITNIISQTSGQPIAFELPVSDIGSAKRDHEGGSDWLDEICSSFLAQRMDRGRNPKVYDKLLTILRDNSIDRMSEDRWLGLPTNQESGTPIEINNGRTIAANLLESVSSELGHNGPIRASSPGLRLIKEGLRPGIEAVADQAEAEAALGKTRSEFAGLRLENSRLIWKRSRRAKDLNERFEAKRQEYLKLVATVGYSKLAKLNEQATLSRTEAVVFVADEITREHIALSGVEEKILEDDNKLRARFARWYAKRSNMLATDAVGGIALGIGVGYGLKKQPKAWWW